MIKYYRIENGKTITGQGGFLPEGNIRYTDDNIPEPVKIRIKEMEEFISKRKKKFDLDNIKVKTSKGNIFDGNDIARNSMSEAIQSAEILNTQNIMWKLVNNDIVEIQIEELKEALALSIQEKGKIITEK